MKKDWLKILQTYNWPWRPFAFDRVVVSGRTEAGEYVEFSLLGTCYSEFKSGPSLMHLANVTGALLGSGMYGLKGCRFLG